MAAKVGDEQEKADKVNELKKKVTVTTDEDWTVNMPGQYLA